MRYGTLAAALTEAVRRVTRERGTGRSHVVHVAGGLDHDRTDARFCGQADDGQLIVVHAKAVMDGTCPECGERFRP